MNAKTVNYTPEQTQKMINDYQAGVSVETIADNLGKTVRSIVAKLSREKVYIKKEYKTKTGESEAKCGHGKKWHEILINYGLEPNPFHNMEIKK